ncbi:MAG: hypothetical protein ACLFR0_05350 [Alphaproteobacteria bacterium]
MHKAMLITIIALVVLGALLTIAQIWVPLFSWDIYAKIIVTFLILCVVLGLVMVLKTDLGEHKKMKDENYLD